MFSMQKVQGSMPNGSGKDLSLKRKQFLDHLRIRARWTSGLIQYKAISRVLQRVYKRMGRQQSFVALSAQYHRQMWTYI